MALTMCLLCCCSTRAVDLIVHMSKIDKAAGPSSMPAAGLKAVKRLFRLK